MALANSIGELIGNTPLVKINKLEGADQANVYVKLESFNPLSSVKDRLGLATMAKQKDFSTKTL